MLLELLILSGLIISSGGVLALIISLGLVIFSGSRKEKVEPFFKGGVIDD